MKSKVFVVLVMFFACATEEQLFPELKGEYFGQTPPGSEAVYFAKGIISDGLNNRDLTVSPKGDEIFYGTFFGNKAIILHTKLENGMWTEPAVASFSGEYPDLEPYFSHDGNKVNFLSARTPVGKEPKPGWTYQNIWVTEKTSTGWSDPVEIGSPISSDTPEFFPSFTSEGTIYYTKTVGRDTFIFRSSLKDGKFTEPEKVPLNVTTAAPAYNASIAPDESYLIACIGGREDSFGGADLYAFFRYEDDTWSDAVNLGEKVNTKYNVSSVNLSPDGKYMFYSAVNWGDSEKTEWSGRTITELQELHKSSGNGGGDIFWIETRFIETLRPVK